MRGFEIGFKNRIVKISAGNIAACIDVNRCHGFGLFNDQIAARFQINASTKRAFDFFFDGIQIKQRPLTCVVGQFR